MQSGPMAVSPLRVFVKTPCIEEYAIIYPQHKIAPTQINIIYQSLPVTVRCKSHSKKQVQLYMYIYIYIVWCIFPSPVKLSNISRYTRFPPQPEGYNVSGPESRNQDQSQSHNLKHDKIQGLKKLCVGVGCWSQ